jgi:hypothetical protein
LVAEVSAGDDPPLAEVAPVAEGEPPADDEPPDDEASVDGAPVSDAAPGPGPDASVAVGAAAGGPFAPPEEPPGLAGAASAEARIANRIAAQSNSRARHRVPGATDLPAGRRNRTPVQRPHRSAVVHGLDGPGRLFPPSPIVDYSLAHLADIYTYR